MFNMSPGLRAAGWRSGTAARFRPANTGVHRDFPAERMRRAGDFRAYAQIDRNETPELPV